MIFSFVFECKADVFSVDLADEADEGPLHRWYDRVTVILGALPFRSQTVLQLQSAGFLNIDIACEKRRRPDSSFIQRAV